MGMYDTVKFNCPNDGCGHMIEIQTKSFGCTLDTIQEGSDLIDESGMPFCLTGCLLVSHYVNPYTCDQCKKNSYALVLAGKIVQFCSQERGESFEKYFQSTCEE